MSKPKSTQYVEKTRANPQDCFGIAGATYHFIMAQTGRAKNKNKNKSMKVPHTL